MAHQSKEIQITNLKLIVGAAFVLFVIAAGLVILLSATKYGMRGIASYEKMNKEISEGTKELQALKAHEEAELSKFGWADKSAGKVQIPIERAMELVIIEAHQKNPSRSGTQK